MTKYGEYQKKYFKENKEKISIYLTRKIICECGKEISYVNMKKHKNTNTHKYKVALKENNISIDNC